MLFCALKLVWDLLSRPSAQTVHPFICLSVYPSVSPLRPSSICQFVSLSTRQSVYPSVHPSVCFSLSRLSVRPPALLPSTLLSVYPFVRSFVSPFVFPSVCPSIHTFECPFLRPSMRLSICPSVHSVRRSDLSFWSSVRPSVCLSVFPTIHPLVLSFVRTSDRPSVRPSNHLSIYNGSWLMATEIYQYYCKGIEIHACVQNPTLNAYYENQTLGFDENVDCLQVKPVHVSQTLDISKLTYFSFSICKNGLTTRTLTTQKTVIGTTVP